MYCSGIENCWQLVMEAHGGKSAVLREAAIAGARSADQ
jgi:hypothetical protein